MKVAVILIDRSSRRRRSRSRSRSVSKRKELFLLFLSLFVTAVTVFECVPHVQCMTLSNFSEIPYQQQLLSTERTSAVGIKEAIVIPTNDPHKEAQRLYNEALLQFGATMKTMKEVCGSWETRGCICSGSTDKTTLNCRGQLFNALSFDDFPETLIKLDLGYNNITSLPNKSFGTLQHLEELILSDNNLINIDTDAFVGLEHNLKRIVLHNCNITEIPLVALHKLSHLTFLQLTSNSITSLHNVSLAIFKYLKSLRLDSNALDHVPTSAIDGLYSLDALNLENNLISTIDDGDFPLLSNLTVLLLKRNKITDISAGAFNNLARLRVLDLDDNLLVSIPSGVKKLNFLQELSLNNNNRIKRISGDDLPRNLIIFEMRGNPITHIEDTAFHNMHKLRKLILSESRALTTLPSLNGCGALEILKVDHCSLVEIPSDLCRTSSRLKSLEAKFNNLKSVPLLRGCTELRLLDLAGNMIDNLNGRPFTGLERLQDLLLAQNDIIELPEDAFTGPFRLKTLDLQSNRIKSIHGSAFSKFVKLEDLNLADNFFDTLPTGNYLKDLLFLKTYNNPYLRDFPTRLAFEKIQSLRVSYAYHCCLFLPYESYSIFANPALHDEVYFPSDNEFDFSLWNITGDFWPELKKKNLTAKFDNQIHDLMHSYGSEYGLSAYPSEYYDELQATPSDAGPGAIQCFPQPGPFLPCQDLFDWWTLRCGVWVVFLLALLGNGTVVFVLIFSRSKMDVPRFLVCNLAAADFFMGVYLGMLAVVDASTLGEFRKYAIKWQMSVGCQLAGFLAVLSSELSVFTLAVITLERNYAITHAMHLNKRLSLRHASYIMSIGWTFALIMATLPLFGISDYRKFAVCLPFETEGSGSLTYVVSLMFINGLAFLILMGCYLKMYCAIRGSQAWNSNDSRIAKRMALLVFTDFLCWSPIAFFSLTAIYGWRIVSLEQAKVFTVFVLPLNSCCNPFLYAILTKQFKKDCVMICKAIEESRVTRGIGRCRHSSNFSNRHTPANTNSLIERSSREFMPPLLPGQTCNCAKLLEQQHAKRLREQEQLTFLERLWRRVICREKNKGGRHLNKNDHYAYQIAEIQQKQHKRAGSMSSSENFSSSRSDSWRHGPPHHHCGIPMRYFDPRRRHTSWLVTRKTSQDSNLSSSRNDSSGSNTTQTTSTWRMSRSSASSNSTIPGIILPLQSGMGRQSFSGPKPRLVRQQAVHEDAHLDLSNSTSPPKLGVRFLPTIPSAADSSMQLDEDTPVEEENPALYTVLQSGQPQSTLSSRRDSSKPS